MHAARTGLQLNDGAVSGGAAFIATMEVADALKVDEDHVNVFPEGQANLTITKQAHLSIQSDPQWNPAGPEYDMGVPPATYDKAIKCSNCGDWLQAMKTELGMMSEMRVWELVEPPPG